MIKIGGNVVKALVLDLRSGNFDIADGEIPSAQDPNQPFLSYAENDIWHVKCRPDDGIVYDAKITVPGGTAEESISINACDAAIVSVPLTSGTITVKLGNSAAELDLAARRIILRLGKGSANVRVRPQVSATFECGLGRLNVFLRKNVRGYRYNIIHGAGSVVINSIPSERRTEIGPADGIPVFIKCGLGSINISEY